MKVNEVVDEFKKRRWTKHQSLDYISRECIRACRAFSEYQKYLSEKHLAFEIYIEPMEALLSRTRPTFASPEQYMHNVQDAYKGFSPQELSRLKDKYARMLNAKERVDARFHRTPEPARRKRKLREANEFERRSYTGDELAQRLFRYQAACGTEVYKYMKYLQDKTGVELTTAELSDYQTRSRGQFAIPQEYVRNVARSNKLTPAELHKLEFLFTRMCKAKEKFQTATGESVSAYARKHGGDR